MVAIVGKEQNGPPWRVNPFCTCTHYTIYANYANHAIYVQYVQELKLMTALLTAVGAITLMTQILGQSSVQRLCQSSVKCQSEWRNLFTSRPSAQCQTSLGVPIIYLTSWSTRNRRAARTLGVLCHSNTAEAGPRSPCAHETPIEYRWKILKVGLGGAEVWRSSSEQSWSSGLLYFIGSRECVLLTASSESIKDH